MTVVDFIYIYIHSVHFKISNKRALIVECNALFVCFCVVSALETFYVPSNDESFFFNE